MSAESTQYFVTGGAVASDAPSYVERQADKDLIQALLGREFCYVLTSRQMGKTSLMVRATRHLREQGVCVVTLDFAALGQNLTAEQWYNGFVTTLARQVWLEDEIEAYWEAHLHLGPVQRLVSTLQEVILVKRSEPIVLFVDEVDVVRSLPFNTDEFFGAISSCYDRRQVEGAFARLTFCLLGVATPSDLIKDTRTTLFNIGQRISLHDFTEREVMTLSRGLEGHGQDGRALLHRVFRWTHGHPYLTQRLCRSLAEQNTPCRPRDVDRLSRELFLSSRAKEMDDNLIFVREHLLRNGVDRAGLLTLYKKVHSRWHRIPDDASNPFVSVLRLAGVVAPRQGILKERNRIYHRAFDRKWIDTYMPDAIAKAQRRAYWKGLLLATGVSTVVLTVMVILVVMAIQSKEELLRMTARSLVAQGRLIRHSGLIGQQTEALSVLGEAARLQPSREILQEASAAMALIDLSAGRVWEGYPPGATATCVSPDFRWWAWADREGTIRVETLEDHHEVWKSPGKLPGVGRLFFSADSRRLAAHCMLSPAEDACFVWRVGDWSVMLQRTNAFSAQAMDMTADGRHFGLGYRDGLVQVIDLETDQVIDGFKGGADEAACRLLRFHPRRLAVAVHFEETVGILLRGILSDPMNLRLHTPASLRLMAWHPGGAILAGVGDDNQIRLWDVNHSELAYFESGRLVSTVREIAFNRSGNLLATAGPDAHLGLWDPYKGLLLVRQSIVVDFPQLVFSPDDRLLGVQRTGTQATLWELQTNVVCQRLHDLTTTPPEDIAIHPGGRILAVATSSGLDFWDLWEGTKLASPTAGNVSDLRFISGSEHLFIREFEGVSLLALQGQSTESTLHYRLERARELPFVHGDALVDFSREARLMATCMKGVVRVFDPEKGPGGEALLRDLDIVSMSLSPDGSLLAVATQQGTSVRIVNVLSGDRTRLSAEGPVDVRFSPDGRWLATASSRTCTLWETTGWSNVLTLPCIRGNNQPSPMAFSGDGRLWAFARTDDQIQVRALEGGGRWVNLECPAQGSLKQLALSSNGLHLVATLERPSSLLAWDLGRLSRRAADMRLEHLLPIDAGPAELARPHLDMEVALEPYATPAHYYTFEDAKRLKGMDAEIQMDPENAPYRRDRAAFYLQHGDYHQALSDYQAWIELTPSDPWPHRDVARLYLFGPPGIRDYELAHRHTSEAIRLNGMSFDNSLYHGIACFRIQALPDALHHLGIALQRQENAQQAVAGFYQAMTLAQLDRKEAGRQALAQAVQALSSLPEAKRHALKLELLGLDSETAACFSDGP